MKKDVVIIGAGPAGIFAALEMIKKGSKKVLLSLKRASPLKKDIAPRIKHRNASTVSLTVISKSIHKNHIK